MSKFFFVKTLRSKVFTLFCWQFFSSKQFLPKQTIIFGMGQNQINITLSSIGILNFELFWEKGSKVTFYTSIYNFPLETTTEITKLVTNLWIWDHLSWRNKMLKSMSSLGTMGEWVSPYLPVMFRSILRLAQNCWSFFYIGLFLLTCKEKLYRPILFWAGDCTVGNLGWCCHDLLHRLGECLMALYSMYYLFRNYKSDWKANYLTRIRPY